MSIDGIPRQDWGPGGETRNAPTEPTASAPAPVSESKAVATTEPGKIERPDWDGPQGEQAEVQLPAENAGAAIGLGPDLVETWEREGGYQQNLARAQATATKILSVEGVGDLQEKFDAGLPQSIQNKVYDSLRLSPSHGPNAALMRLDQIEKSLTPDELATAEKWLKSLTPEQSRALLFGLGK
jgi:hypothetical protein